MPEEKSGRKGTPETATEYTRLLSVKGNSLRRSVRSFSKDPNAGRTLTWFSVVFITYFNVSGGPWGSELIISSCGPLPGFLGLLFSPLVSGLPMVLVTSELSSLYPDDGGYSIWVAEAFGEFWGFQLSFWSWCSGIMDNALYPILTYKLAEELFFHGSEESSSPNGVNSFVFGWTVKAALVVLFSAPNVFLLHDLGTGLMIAFIAVMIPFLMLSVHGLLTGDPSNVLQMRDGALDLSDSSTWHAWTGLLNVLYWNTSGFDCISTCAGEIKNPGKSIFKGLVVCLILTVLTYLIPLTAAVYINQPPWQTWTEGSFTKIAQEQVGLWLGFVVLISGAVGNFGMHVAELFEDTWQLNGMANCGLAPKIFGYKHPTYKTPITAIAFEVVLMCIAVGLPFKRLLMIDNFFSIAAGILKYLSFVQLRRTVPRAYRAFRVPVNTLVEASLIILPGVVMSSIVLLSSLLRDPLHMALDMGGILAGVLLYMLWKGSQPDIDESVNSREYKNEKLQRVAVSRQQKIREYDKLFKVAKNSAIQQNKEMSRLLPVVEEGELKVERKIPPTGLLVRQMKNSKSKKGTRKTRTSKPRNVLNVTRRKRGNTGLSPTRPNPEGGTDSSKKNEGNSSKKSEGGTSTHKSGKL
eukprot:CAMPEP_0114516692 /NCGR_PEP_ID=MMETSP0109-20121206/17469_1 /TAXON_ID=29199 /ORGANISM="Chlorarachnion reptans, Strain CCCM449" /LENGTH=634 /DNA_ID=CAMNT_0001697109 /DNA_START=114 /DNA_END=2018 /DNA_ORIENTATION=+